MNDDKPEFICEECGVALSSIFDYLVHIEILPEVLVKLDDTGVNLDLWRVMEEIYYLADEGNTEDIKSIAESVGLTLYSLKTGLLKEQIEEIIVETSLTDLDQKLKEFLDEQADNDK